MTPMQKTFRKIECFAIWAHPDHRPEKWQDASVDRFTRTIRILGAEAVFTPEHAAEAKLFAEYVLALSISVGALKLVGRFKKLPRMANARTFKARTELLAHMKDIGQPLIEEQST